MRAFGQAGLGTSRCNCFQGRLGMFREVLHHGTSLIHARIPVPRFIMNPMICVEFMFCIVTVFLFANFANRLHVTRCRSTRMNTGSGNHNLVLAHNRTLSLSVLKEVFTHFASVELLVSGIDAICSLLFKANKIVHAGCRIILAFFGCRNLTLLVHEFVSAVRTRIVCLASICYTGGRNSINMAHIVMQAQICTANITQKVLRFICAFRNLLLTVITDMRTVHSNVLSKIFYRTAVITLVVLVAVRVIALLFLAAIVTRMIAVIVLVTKSASYIRQCTLRATAMVTPCRFGAIRNTSRILITYISRVLMHQCIKNPRIFRNLFIGLVEIQLTFITLPVSGISCYLTLRLNCRRISLLTVMRTDQSIALAAIAVLVLILYVNRRNVLYYTGLRNRPIFFKSCGVSRFAVHTGQTTRLLRHFARNRCSSGFLMTCVIQTHAFRCTSLTVNSKVISHRSPVVSKSRNVAFYCFCLIDSPIMLVIRELSSKHCISRLFTSWCILHARSLHTRS